MNSCVGYFILSPWQQCAKDNMYFTYRGNKKDPYIVYKIVFKIQTDKLLKSKSKSGLCVRTDE